LIDALAWDAVNPEPAPVRTGPQHIDAFLKALSRKPDGSPES
jgi:hypothetical protein